MYSTQYHVAYVVGNTLQMYSTQYPVAGNGNTLQVYSTVRISWGLRIIFRFFRYRKEAGWDLEKFLVQVQIPHTHSSDVWV